LRICPTIDQPHLFLASQGKGAGKMISRSFGILHGGVSCAKEWATKEKVLTRNGVPQPPVKPKDPGYPPICHLVHLQAGSNHDQQQAAGPKSPLVTACFSPSFYYY